MLSKEELEKFDALISEASTITAQIKSRMLMQATNDAIAAPSGRVSEPAQPVNNTPSITGGQDMSELDEMNGFANAADFAQSVRSACAGSGMIDERLKVKGAPTNFH